MFGNGERVRQLERQVAELEAQMAATDALLLRIAKALQELAGQHKDFVSALAQRASIAGGGER